MATIDNGVEVKKSLLKSAGRGLFAARAFHEGAYITQYAGPKLDDKLAAASCAVQTHILHASAMFAGQIGPDVYIDGIREPTPGEGGGSFANHREQKLHCNAEFVLSADRDVYLRATRNILPGDEIYAHCGTDTDVMMGRKRRVVTKDIDGGCSIGYEVIPSGNAQVRLHPDTAPPSHSLSGSPSPPASRQGPSPFPSLFTPPALGIPTQPPFP